MKILSIAISLLFAAQLATAQPGDKYTAAMTKNLNAIGDAFKNPDNLLALANNFERIGEAEKTQWLPYYYAAFCQVNYGFMQQDKSKTDMLAAKATELIDKANALSAENSEISCIKSMIASCQLMVDPMQRYMEYGAESSKQLEIARKQDPTNPRPDYLMAQALKYTPEQFGGGCATAKPKIEEALKKFEAFVPASPMHPNWGKEMAQQMLAECK
ncbi:MAG: hypothetical protein EOO03_07475 [Chitinophagaceae bacterium]|nr:MAG: hypothetical protein EOO03_07475 [Chitinophagaceae bacterium]